MCGMNLAFDRTLIGPAMYFGLMGEGQPIGRYDDMWAGWCSKVSVYLEGGRRGMLTVLEIAPQHAHHNTLSPPQVICDHLNLGVKTGLPYIWHSKASNPFVNLKKEYNGIFWQEDAIKFFQGVSLTSKTVEECYLELADEVRAELTSVDPYFTKLATGMEDWIASWRTLQSQVQ